MPYLISLKEAIRYIDNGVGKSTLNVVADTIISDCCTPNGMMEYKINEKINYISIANVLGTTYHEKENE